ncbi:MAG: redoxin domain-containing protein, partial [Acidobacteriaceae bacterium]|nr:redoxin domain-containing protein [Acidobacteriaceae bacterium]
MAFLAASVSAAQFDAGLKDELNIGDRAPAIEGSQWVGAARAPELKDKVVLVDFWYAACPTCVHKMPEISELAE